MAKAKIVDANEEIKKLVATPKAIVGSDRTLKSLRAGKVAKIFLSKNVAEETKNDIESYAKISKVEIVQLDLTNTELGTICKKPYSISVLSESK